MLVKSHLFFYFHFQVIYLFLAILTNCRQDSERRHFLSLMSIAVKNFN